MSVHFCPHVRTTLFAVKSHTLESGEASACTGPPQRRAAEDLLVKGGADAEAIDTASRSTALHLACRSGNTMAPARAPCLPRPPCFL